MPVYNTEDYIDSAIESILSQTYKNYELIIINDGSTDKSLEKLLSYKAKDNRISIISPENKGPSAARNRGLEIAQGDYIYFMDSDDLLVPECLSICFELALQKQLDLIAFSGEAFSEIPGATEVFKNYQKPEILTPISGEDLLLHLFRQGAYSPSPCLYFISHTLLLSMNSYFDEGYLHEDEGFTVELYCHAERAISLSNIFFKRRVRNDSIMTKPRTWDNVQGLVQASARIERLVSLKKMNKSTSKTLCNYPANLLRRARKISEEIRRSDDFIILVKHLFSTKLLFIDPAMLIYVYTNWLYCCIRALWHSFKFLFNYFNFLKYK